MDVKFEITNINKLTRTLRKMESGEELLKQLEKAHAKAAEIVEARADPNIPRRKGKLAASLRSKGTKKAGVVRVGKASLPYAGPIHFGWPERGIPPQPFLYEALDERRKEVYEFFWKAVNEVLDEVARRIG